MLGKDGLLVTLDISMIVVISFGHQLANSCGHGADKWGWIKSCWISVHNNLPHFTVINGIVTETQKIIILMLKLGQKVNVLVMWHVRQIAPALVLMKATEVECFIPTAWPWLNTYGTLLPLFWTILELNCKCLFSLLPGIGGEAYWLCIEVLFKMKFIILVPREWKRKMLHVHRQNQMSYSWNVISFLHFSSFK